MKNFASFYKDFGVRTPTVFNSPVPHPVRELSKGAILHLPAEEGRDFPDPSLVFLHKLSTRVYLYNEMEMVAENHALSQVRVQKEVLAREWLLSNRKIFQGTSKPVSAITDENQLVAVNYGLIDNGVKYRPEAKLTPYFSWLDRQKTMWTKVNDIAKTTNRINYILVKTGDAIPSMAALRMASKEFGTTNAPFFDTEYKMLILDIWKWLEAPEKDKEGKIIEGSGRSNSAMGALSTEHFPRTCFVFQMFDGTSIIISLGYLNSWIRGQENQVEGVGTVPQKDVREIQTSLLKFLLTIQNYNIEGQKAAREAEAKKEGDRREGDQDPGTVAELEGEEVSPGSEASGQAAQQGKPGLPSPAAGKDVSGIGQSVLEHAAAGRADGTQAEPVATAENEASFQEEMKILEEMEGRRIRASGVLQEELPYDPEEPTSAEEIFTSIATPPKFGDNIIKHLDKLVDRGAISAPEYRKTIRAIEEFKKLPDPFTGKGNILEASTVKAEDMEFDPVSMSIKDPLGITNAALQSSCVEELDRGYIKQMFKKEMLASAIGLTDMNTLISDFQIDERETAEGRKMFMSMKVSPIGGKSSILRHEFPVPDLDGTFKAKGVRYHSRKQVNDDNERKIQGDQVALGTYTSKLFVTRTRAKAHNVTAFISKQLTAAQLGEVPGISRVRPANVYDREFKAPYFYSTISEHFKGFDLDHKLFGKLTFDFEARTRDEILGPDMRSSIEKSGNVLCGKSDKGLPIYITKANEFFVRTKNGDEPLGTIFDLVGVDEGKAPVEYAEVGIIGQDVPVGMVMGRQMGFRKLLKMSGVDYRIAEGRSVTMEPHEFRVRFKDVSFIFSKRDRLASNLFGGFSVNMKYTKNFPAASFDSSEAYDAVLESQGLNQMHLREIENLDMGFVDPISRRRLKAKGSPQTFLALLFKSCQDLTNNESPETQDTDSQQILGYERFAGALHREVYRAFRSFRNQNSTGRGKINMSHFAVWQQIMSDGTIKTCEDINPIQNLKMHEALTFSGEGGRSRETFNLPARAFNKKAPGVHSEASVDSGDVAYNLFMPWNPTLGDLNGKRKEVGELGYGNLLSTSLNLVVGPNHNDMKRNVFTSIQNTHTIACDGYEVSRVQTGAESMVGQRTDDLFCKTARQPGKVISVSDRGIVVEYADKTREGVILGRRYGDAEGTTYPHDLVTNLKVGDKVGVGETIAYNTGFFEPMAANPKFSTLKFGTYANVAFMELPETHEDSCAITPVLAEKLGTWITDPRSYELRFTQNVHEVLPVGSKTEPDTVLMVIEDEITSGTGIFDAQSTTTLGRLSRDAPRAGGTGTLDNIECFYHGDKADLSPSLRKLVDASDRRRSEMYRAAGGEPITGKVTSDWSVKGSPLQLDHLEVIFNVTSRRGMANADKLVFSEQLKSTVGKVEMREITTVSGRKVDATFGGSSVIKRITLTVVNNGSTIRITDHGEKEAVAAYFG